MTTECPICAECFTKVLRRPVDCGACDFSACRECTQRFLVSNPNEPQCMSCKAQWNMSFLRANTTATFIDGPFKEHRKKMIWEREQSRLPETQANIMEDMRFAEHKKELWAEACRLKDRDQNPELAEIHDIDAALRAAVEVKKAEIKALQNDMDNLWTPHRRAVRLAELAHFYYKPEKTKTKKQFIRGCCGEDCSGFLDDKWNCGICGADSCRKCLTYLKGVTDHECDDDDVATAKMIAKDCKACPGCATMITKIDGCDQMWCPECHVAFSWVHGTIEKGHIHNPHYFQHLRNASATGEIPRNAGRRDAGCDGHDGLPYMNAAMWRQPDRLAPVADRHGHFTRVVLTPTQVAQDYPRAKIQNTVCSALRLAYHIEGVELAARGRFGPTPADPFDTQRRDYLGKKVTKKAFVDSTIRAETRHAIQFENRQVLETVRTVIGEIVKKRLGSVELSDWEAAKVEVEKLVKFTNEAFRAIPDTYKVCHYLKVDENLSLIKCSLKKGKDTTYHAGDKTLPINI